MNYIESPKLFSTRNVVNLKSLKGNGVRVGKTIDCLEKLPKAECGNLNRSISPRPFNMVFPKFLQNLFIA